MEKQVLSIAQMQKLKELGVDTSKASMCFVHFESDGIQYDDLVVHDEDCYEMALQRPVPTFTLQDIIGIMPKRIDGCYLTIEVRRFNIAFSYGINTVTSMRIEIEDELLNAAYEMLCSLAEKGYLK